jgi:hypothetical protein
VWSDGNKNGIVGPEDLAMWRANYGSAAAAVPEPATVLLLGISFFVGLFASRGSRVEAANFAGALPQPPVAILKKDWTKAREFGILSARG